jgi:four helix bundle protein
MGLVLLWRRFLSEAIMSASFRELRVWQQSIELALQIYRGTETFPKHELYGLSQQMRRAAVSVPSNIAEGKGHRSDKEFQRFLFHARGSLMELETQILLAGKLQYLSTEQSRDLQLAATQVGRSLAGLLDSLSTAA